MATRFFAPAYRAMLAEDRHERPQQFTYAMERLFHGVHLGGVKALEIGSGTGLQALYMAQRGATVTSLEPEGVGATAGVIAKQRERCRRLGLMDRVTVVAADFNAWESSERFDVILSKNSLNHLHPSEYHARSHQPTRDAYLGILRHIRSLLAPDGVLVATDAARYGFFSLVRDYGIRRPWTTRRSGTNWRHHQTAFTWRRLLREAGLSRVDISYPVPYRLRHLAVLMNAAPAAFFLSGRFIIHARPDRSVNPERVATTSAPKSGDRVARDTRRSLAS